MTRKRRLLILARSRSRRRTASDGPWYDRRQVDIHPVLQALQRVYWRAVKRSRRRNMTFGETPATARMSRFFALVRDARPPYSKRFLREVVRNTRGIEKALDAEFGHR